MYTKRQEMVGSTHALLLELACPWYRSGGIWEPVNPLCHNHFTYYYNHDSLL